MKETSHSLKSYFYPYFERPLLGFFKNRIEHKILNNSTNICDYTIFLRFEPIFPGLIIYGVEINSQLELCGLIL